VQFRIIEDVADKIFGEHTASRADHGNFQHGVSFSKIEFFALEICAREFTIHAILYPI
jgi:hypothetical protein